MYTSQKPQPQSSASIAFLWLGIKSTRHCLIIHAFVSGYHFLACSLQALKQSTGAQKQQYESWRKLLLQCLANVEAVIDFGEDEGIAEEVAEQVLPRVQQLGTLLQQHLITGTATL